MTVHFDEGQIYLLSTGNLNVYVVIVPHIFDHQLGFKALVDQQRKWSVSINEISHYQYTFVGTINDDNYSTFMREVGSSRNEQLKIWKLFGAERHYRSDLALASLHANGVITSRSPAIIGVGSKTDLNAFNLRQLTIPTRMSHLFIGLPR